MSQSIEAFEKYFQCVKLNMPTPPLKIGLSTITWFLRNVYNGKGC